MPDRSIVARLRADISDYRAKMRDAATATESVAQAGEKTAARGKVSFASMAASVDTHKASIADLSSQSIKLGVATGIGVGVAIRSYANFDQQMSSVKATGADARANFDALRDAAVDMGAKTSFSATEAAQGVENLLKAGVGAREVLGGGLKGSLDLAAAGSISVAEASEVAATAMTQFKLSGADVPHIADLLAAGAGKAQGEVSDMAAALKQSGLVASQFGLSIEDTTGTLAAFASAGLLGSDAGTSLKTMLLSLANPSKESAATMRELGISAYDAQGNFVGVENLAGQLQSRLGGLSQAQRDAALAQIFGNDAVRAANVLYNQGSGGIAGWIAQVNDQGYAAETAATKLDNLKGDLEGFSGAIESAFIRSGSGANSVLRELVQGATSAVNVVGNLPAPLLQAGLGIGAVASAGLLAVGGISKLAVAANNAKIAFTALGITARGATLAAGGIGAVLGVAALALGAYASNAAASKGRVEDFTEALKSQNDAIQQNVTNVATKQLQDVGALAAARNLGLSLSDVTAAALGNADAMARVGAVTEQVFQEGLNSSDVNLLQRVDDARLLTDAIGRTGSEYNKAVQDAKDFAAASGEAGSSNRAAAEAATQQVTAYAALDKSLSALNTKSGLAADQTAQLAKSMFAEGDAAQAAVDAHSAYEAAIDSASETLAKNGDHLNKAGKALSDNTAKGRENISALNGLASSGKAYVQSLVAQGAGAAEAASATAGVRKQFIAAARDAGLSAREAGKLADSYGLIPSKVTTEFDAFGLALQQQKVADYQAALAGIPPEQRSIIESIFKKEGAEAARRKLAELSGVKATPEIALAGAKLSASQADDVNTALKNIPASKRAEVITIAETKGAAAAKRAMEAIKDKTVIARAKGELKGAREVNTVMKALKDRYVKAVARGDKAGAAAVKRAMDVLKGKTVTAGTKSDLSGKSKTQRGVNSLKGKDVTAGTKSDLSGKNKTQRGVNSLKGKSVTAGTKADTGGVRTAQNAVDRFHGKTVTVKIKYSGSKLAALKGGATGGLFTDGDFSHRGSGPIRRSDGGPVWGEGTATSDSIPAMLSDGEFVQRAAATAYYGVGFMSALNNMRVPKDQLPAYAQGGPVGAAQPGSVDQRAIFSLITAIVNPLKLVAQAEAARATAARNLASENRRIAGPRARLDRATSRYRDAVDDRDDQKAELARLKKRADATKGFTRADREYKKAQQELREINVRVTATSKEKTAAQAAYNKVAERSKAASEKLKEAQQALAEQQKAVADSARQVADGFTSQYRSQSTDARDWIDLMRTGATDIAGFTARIAQLRKAGLNETLVQQIIGMGATAGSEIATQIAGSGAGLVAELNRANSSLTTAADKLGYLGATGIGRYAGGGPLAGPGTGTSDSFLIAASDGEFMQRRAAVDRYGLGFMHAVNNLQFQPTQTRPVQYAGYAGGGPIHRQPMIDSAALAAAVRQGMAGSTWTARINGDTVDLRVDRAIGNLVTSFGRAHG